MFGAYLQKPFRALVENIFLNAERVKLGKHSLKEKSLAVLPSKTAYLKARADYCDSAATSNLHSALRLIGIMSNFSQQM